MNSKPIKSRLGRISLELESNIYCFTLRKTRFYHFLYSKIVIELVYTKYNIMNNDMNYQVSRHKCADMSSVDHFFTVKHQK